jgi:opacity protein-like surface antigen
MRLRILAAVICVFLFVSGSDDACAQQKDRPDSDSGFYAGLDITGGKTFGSSDTRNGGSGLAGGGIVENVEFDDSAGIGGHIGYKLNPALSASVSYQYIRSGLRWDARFPSISAASGFKGHAISHEIMAKLSYGRALSDKASFHVDAGAGFTINTLSNVIETDVGTGLFLSNVGEHASIHPAAQIGAGIERGVTPALKLDLKTSLDYIGGFETGNTRKGNLGVTAITPYKIDRVWRASLGAAMHISF